MIYHFLISAFIFISTLAHSFAINPHDSLPSINPDYKGYRLAITDISTEKQNDEINFNFTVINTGRETIEWKENGLKNDIIFNFEYEETNQDLKQFESSLINSIFEIPLNLKAGQILFNQKVSIKSNAESIAAETTEIQEGKLSTTSALSKGISEEPLDENLCSDLIIESISIVKKSNNSVTLKYKIKNQGKQAAYVSGATKKVEDNLAMTFHMSSTEKLTRGAIPIGGAFVKEGRQIPDGKLYPGKSVTDEIKLDIRNMTKFTPIIIIELDPYLSVVECDETNNQNHIKIKK